MRQHPFEHPSKVRRHAAVFAVTCTGIATGLIASAPAQAAPRDNLAQAKRCQHDGWKTLKTIDGRSFRNQGWCIAYALLGGQFSSTTPTGGGE